MIKVDVSNWSSKKSVLKLLCFESHKIMFFFAFCEKGPFFNLKKSCIINGLRPLRVFGLSVFAVAKTRYTLLEYGQSKVQGRTEYN